MPFQRISFISSKGALNISWCPFIQISKPILHDWYMTDMWLIYCWCWCWKSQNTRNTHTFQKYTKNSKDFLFKNGSWVDGQMVPLDHTFDGFKVAQTFHRLSFLSAGYHTLIFSFFIGDHMLMSKHSSENKIKKMFIKWIFFQTCWMKWKSMSPGLFIRILYWYWYYIDYTLWMAIFLFFVSGSPVSIFRD